MHKQLIQEITHEEFLNTVNTVEMVSYGAPRMVKTLFDNKMKDEIDLIDVTNEASKEYHATKTDMLCNSKQSRQPKKKK